MAPGKTEPIRGAPPPPDTYDEVVQDHLPDDLEADFAPLTYGSPVDRREIDPFQYDSLEAERAFDAANTLAAEGKEQEAIQEFIRAAKIAETAREWHLAAVACRRVGDFLSAPAPPYDLERAFRMYRRAVAAYEQSGLFAEARELAFRMMCCRMGRARDLGLPLGQRLELRFHWAMAGFGYRPVRVAAMAALIICFYTVVYWLGGGVVSGSGAAAPDFLTALYFSGVVFTTVGFGDFVPAPAMRLAALSEGFLGAFTIGLFAAVMANRLNRG